MAGYVDLVSVTSKNAAVAEERNASPFRDLVGHRTRSSWYGLTTVGPEVKPAHGQHYLG
jgi:hypothetical protein